MGGLVKVADDEVPLDEEEPDTHKYGIRDAVMVRLGMLGQSPSRDLVTTALNSADVHVDNQLRKARLTVPTQSPYDSALVEAATYYATAEALQPLFNASENYSENVEYYLNRCSDVLDVYIATEIETLLIGRGDDHPYSHSHTPPKGTWPGKRRRRPRRIG